MKLILLDLWYSGKQEDMYIFKIGPSKKVLEIPYPRNSAWLPRGLLVKEEQCKWNKTNSFGK